MKMKLQVKNRMNLLQHGTIPSPQSPPIHISSFRSAVYFPANVKRQIKTIIKPQMHTDETRIKTNYHPCFIRENLWRKKVLNQGQTRATDYRFLFSRSGPGDFGRQIREFAGIEEDTGKANKNNY
jgi:hypothetical protein